MLRCLLVLSLLAAAPAFPADYDLPSDGDGVIGSVVAVPAEFEDTFVSLGRTHGLGYEELVAANPEIDPWLPGTGTAVRLPSQFVLPDAPREGIVLNLAEMRLYYFPEDAATLQTWPISIGHLDADTPIGVTSVVDKLRNPTWYPPERIIAAHAERGDTLPRIVPPGPDNPLGSLALQLGIPGYLIHGTNRPAGIGMRITNGCIRMQPPDIEALAAQVARGTPVRIVNQPYKAGWSGDTLFLEVHGAFEDDRLHVDRGMTAVVERLVAATTERRAEMDWDAVERAYAEARGIPVAVGVAAPTGAAARPSSAGAASTDGALSRRKSSK